MPRLLYTHCRNIFLKKRVNQDLDDEVRSYLELVAAEKVGLGMARQEPLGEARRDLDLEQVKERSEVLPCHRSKPLT